MEVDIDQLILTVSGKGVMRVMRGCKKIVNYVSVSLNAVGGEGHFLFARQFFLDFRHDQIQVGGLMHEI